MDYDDQRAYQSASVVPVLNLKTMLAELAFGYYETPSDAMTVIAVTGTNGKTTVTRWLAQALNALGRKAAVIGTLGFGAPDDLKAHTGLTTPDVVGVHHILHELRQAQFDTVCLELLPLAWNNADWLVSVLTWPRTPICLKTTWTITATWRPTPGQS